MSPSPCPYSASIPLLPAGDLAAPAADALAEHIEQCPHCLEELQRLGEKDTLLEAMKHGAKIGALLADPRLQELVRHVLELSNSFAGGNTSASVSHASIGKSVNEVLAFLSPPQGPDESGRLGPFRILEVLGAGGMGIVLRAEDTQLQRQVALKVMRPELAVKVAARQRFLREARAAAQIDYEHIVAIHHVGEANGVPYLVMPLLQGENLEDRLRREKRLVLVDALQIAREMALGLAAAHDRGLIHRDIKPLNVWLERGSGRVKILDFGLAKPAEDQAELTQTGAVVGTPAYMAPEQAQRGKYIDSRCDLFALGCVFYRLVTGVLPFQGDDPYTILLALATQEPPPPRELNPTIPAALSTLIQRLLAKEPSQRPTSAREVIPLIEAIQKPFLLATEAETRVVARGSATAPPQARKHTTLWRYVMAASLLLVSGGLLAWWLPALWSPTGTTPAMVPLALVAQPTALPGVDSWTVETPQHRGIITDLSYSPNGQWLASSSLDGSIRIWDAQTMNLNRVLVSGGQIWRFFWSPDNTKLLVQDTHPWIWDVVAGKKTVDFPQGGLMHAGWTGDGKTVGFRHNGQLKFYDVDSGDLVETFANCDHAAWTKNKKIVIQVDKEGQPGEKAIRVVDKPSGKELLSFAYKWDSHVFPLSPDGKRLVLDHKILDMETGKVATELRGFYAPFHHPWSPDGQTLAAYIGSASKLGFLNPNTGEIKRTIDLPGTVGGWNWPIGEWPLWAGAWSPDGQKFALGRGTPGHIFVFDGSTGQILHGPPSQAMKDLYHWRLVWSQNGRSLLSILQNYASKREQLERKWDLTTGKISTTRVGRIGLPAPDLKKYANAKEVFEPDQPSQIMKLVGEETHAFGMAWSANGRHLASLDKDQVVRIWDTREGKQLKTIPWQWGRGEDFIPTYHLALSANGRTLFIHGAADSPYSARFHRWDWPGDKSTPFPLSLPEERLTSLHLSPDDKQLATAHVNGQVFIWDVDQRQRVQTLVGHRPGRVVLAWSPDGKYLASQGDDHLLLWDVPTAKVLGHLVPVGIDGGIAINPQGHFRASPPTLEREVVYVIQTPRGQETLSPAEFARRFRWTNNPEQVHWFGAR